jgi:hypothetical protein
MRIIVPVVVSVLFWIYLSPALDNFKSPARFCQHVFIDKVFGQYPKLSSRMVTLHDMNRGKSIVS